MPGRAREFRDIKGCENKDKGGKLTHVSLFSGIGGIDLAAEWVGFETILFCEQDKYCQRILKKHWPDVPIIEDVKDVNSESVSQSVTLVSGGFPCQPFSVAGKRRGKKDDRYLWPEMLRVIQELKPAWVVGENVAGFVNMGLNDTLSDLEGDGYRTQSFLIPACSVYAPHQRNRVFIVAKRIQRRSKQSEVITKNGKERFVANSSSTRRARELQLQVNRCSGYIIKQKTQILQRNSSRKLQKSTNRWSTEPNVGRVAHGISHRVDRLRCLGNAVVPQQVYPILQAIARLEGMVV